MRGKLLFALGIVGLLLFLFGWIGKVEADPHGEGSSIISEPLPSNESNPLESFKAMWTSMMNMLKSVGGFFLTVAHLMPRECLGGILCLNFPLTVIGLWTIRNIGRILGYRSPESVTIVRN